MKPSQLATEATKVAVYENGQIGGTPPPFPDAVRLWSMCPPRKTQRLLGDRTLAADRFGSRGWDANEPADGALYPYPCDGLYAHKDGYNVLYGDGHGAWLGDPQQQWIWITNHAGRASPWSNNRHFFADNMVSYGIQQWLYFDRYAGFAQNLNIAWSPH
jgi:prepilin-type processing-associated H-X9-DG protein